MAGDWIKMRTALAAERSVMIICDHTGLDEYGVIGRLHCIWSWAGEHTTDGEINDVTVRTIDRIAKQTGFAEAMIKAKWLEETPSGIRIPRWDSYNSRAAKERAQAAKRQADKRWRDKNTEGDKVTDVTEESRPMSRDTVTSHDAREEERRREERREDFQSRSADRRARENPVPTPPRPSEPIGHSDLEISNDRESGDTGVTIDLSQIDWDRVMVTAAILGKKIPPKSKNDRRQWFRLAVMCEEYFNHDWLMSAIDEVLRSKEHKRGRAAHLMAILKSAASELGVNAATFRGMSKRIEIPLSVWKSNCIEVKQ